ncbi:hypothetical protein [Arsenophonus endosymbiont of Crataerina pallida]|uniref:hypothetical protein n=1 Tax=Arsenophonus endosymbiont of Crataerina pallida TaxID=3066235 RepID=UPI0030D32393
MRIQANWGMELGWTPVQLQTKENGNAKTEKKGKEKINQETENKEGIDESTEQKPANGTTISQ